MPKLKTHKGAKKRFRVTASGKLKRSQAGKKHLNGPKTGKRKRHLRKIILVQDTFARLIEQLRAHGPLANPRGWLYTVAAHGCRDRQRRIGRWLPWISAHDVRRASERPNGFDDRQAVLHAIRALSSRDRLLIALRTQGLSYHEIGDASGIRHSSVGRILTRALNRLQQELDRRS